MREILYRGWSEEANGGKWVEGIPQYHPADGGGEWRIRIWKVDPESIGQYTGLEDKKGVKIFEGDIISIKRSYEDGSPFQRPYDKPYKAVVVFEFCCFGLKVLDEDVVEFFQGGAGIEYEVVGNTYQRIKNE